MYKHFIVDGYEYYTELDEEPDNKKLFHYCRREDGTEIKMPSAFYNHTPYELMTVEEFTKHIRTVEVFNQG